jgi:hypothetical protein
VTYEFGTIIRDGVIQAGLQVTMIDEMGYTGPHHVAPAAGRWQIGTDSI